jgi:antitoxin (DNA-binding transcriptional repressor) of toxin-antitoxin stability system
LSELVERAAAGEAVCITRCGKPVAQITAVDTPRKGIDVAALKAVTDASAGAAGDGSRVYPQDAR